MQKSKAWLMTSFAKLRSVRKSPVPIMMDSHEVKLSVSGALEPRRK